MKKLGFGMMRLPLICAQDNKSIDIKTVCQMADIFIKNGFTYFDTAYPYHSGESEVAFGEAVAKRYPRDSFTLADKMPMFLNPTKEQMREIFKTQLERCKVDYFDYYLIHALSKERYEYSKEVGAFEYAKQLVDEGKIKHLGFSFHDSPEVLEEILNEQKDVEFVQLQINYLDWEDERVQSRKCYEVCRKYGKKIIVMEPVKGGALSKLNPEAEKLFKDYNNNASLASYAIRYAASLDGVMMVLSGMSNVEQMLDNTGFMKDFEPINKTEAQIIDKATEIVKNYTAVACTACRYCVDGCPKGIPIPDIFSIYNDLKKLPATADAAKRHYASLKEKSGACAGDCIACGQCEGVCPQHLNIIEELKNINKIF